MVWLSGIFITRGAPDKCFINCLKLRFYVRINTSLADSYRARYCSGAAYIRLCIGVDTFYPPSGNDVQRFIHITCTGTFCSVIPLVVVIIKLYLNNTVPPVSTPWFTHRGCLLKMILFPSPPSSAQRTVFFKAHSYCIIKPYGNCKVILDSCAFIFSL